MTKVLYSKEFARFGQSNYSLSAQCDAKNEFYTCTLVKKHGDMALQTITLPFEVMTKMLKRMLYASEILVKHRSLITAMHMESSDLFHKLFKVNVLVQPDRTWLITGIVRVEDRLIYIGIFEDGIPQIQSNVIPSVHLTLEAIVLLANEVNEVKALVDSHDIQAGGVRKHIIGMKVCKETFEATLEHNLHSNVSI